MSDKVYINIARDFSRFPGARTRALGPYSGEEFREKYLEPYFIRPDDDTIIVIDFDGAFGYAPSFLDEAFGGLARKYSKARVLRKLMLRSTSNQMIIRQAMGYINER